MSTDSDILMQNEANSRSSKTEHGVVIGQRVSTRCGRNRVEQSVAACEWSEEAGQWPMEQRGRSRRTAKNAKRSQLQKNINYFEVTS